MDTDTCLPFSSQSSRRTPENSPRLEHGTSGSFLPCDELQKPPHLPPPLPHRLSLRGDLYAAAMGRFGDAAADFTHGAAPVNPPASPSKHKFLDSISQDQKTSGMSGKPVFYDGNSEGKSLFLFLSGRNAQMRKKAHKGIILDEHLASPLLISLNYPCMETKSTIKGQFAAGFEMQNV